MKSGISIKANPENPPCDEPSNPYYCLNTGRYIVQEIEEEQVCASSGVIWISNYDGSVFPNTVRDLKDRQRYKRSRQIIWINSRLFVRDEFLTAARKALKNAKPKA